MTDDTISNKDFLNSQNMGKPTHVSSNKRRLTKTPLKSTSGILKIRSNVKPKAKNRNKSLSQSASKAVANQSRRRRASKKDMSDSEDEFNKCNITTKRQRQWRPLSKSTKEFINKAIDNNINTALGKTKATNYEEVRENLNNLKERIVYKLAEAQGPAGVEMDYNLMYAQSKTMDENLETEKKLLHKIENQLEKQENACDVIEQQITEKTQQLKTLKERVKKNKRKLCPLLQEDFQDELDLPPIEDVNAPKMQAHSYKDVNPSLLKHLVRAQKSMETRKASMVIQNVANMVDYLDNI